MQHEYNPTFFDYINSGARASAKRVLPLMQSWLKPDRVADLGCGQGVWLDEWEKLGVTTVLGVDGDYVDREALSIDPEKFIAADLSGPLPVSERYDLAQSLEVGEHLPKASSERLVKSLTQLSDIVMFSSAVVGQGGEHHINEQPLEYWRQIFAEQGYLPFDYLRSRLVGASDVEPWYRYNTLVYARETVTANLPEEVLATRIPDGQPVRELGDLGWRMRRRIVSVMPRGMVTGIAKLNAARVTLQSRSTWAK